MRSEKITLGESQYLIHELPMRQNAAWRSLLETRVKPLADLLKAAPSLEIPSTVQELQAAGSGESLAGLVDQFRPVYELVMNSPSVMLDLLCAYSPEIDRHREHIEETAYDSELANALLKVLALAFPFGALLPALTEVASSNGATPTPGRRAVRTSRS